jgi:hypothetical protein
VFKKLSIKAKAFAVATMNTAHQTGELIANRTKWLFGKEEWKDMTGPRKGIKDTREAIEAGVKLLEVAQRVGADGWQFSDVRLIINDQELATSVNNALNGASNIMTELSHLSFSETMQLVTYVLNILPTLDKSRK